MKLPRDLSGFAVARGLERCGFTVARQSGSHVRLVKAGQGVTVPLHRSLAVGTLRSILRQSGVSIEALLESLEKRGLRELSAARVNLATYPCA